MKIYIGSAVWRTEEHAYSQAMRQLWASLVKQGMDFADGTVVGDALISRSRSIVASSFLRSDADVLLIIDSDIYFMPENAIELCKKAMELDIVGAMYMTRSMQTQPAMMLPDDEAIIFSPSAEPVEVPFISTGFMAVTKKVFERLSEDLPLCHQGWANKGKATAFWPFYMPYVIPWKGEDGYMYLSEDWAFCQRAKDAGFKIWLDPSIRLGHVGDVMYTLEDLVRQPRPVPQVLRLERDANGFLQTAMHSAGASPALSHLADDVAHFFQKEMPKYGATLPEAGKTANKTILELWESKPKSQTEWEFYKRDDVGEAYVFDLALWHLSDAVSTHYVSNFRQISGQKILDYGSGIGTAAIMLSSQGNVVHAVEPNKVMRGFTDWRAKKFGTNIHWRNGKQQTNYYDMVLCFHVLEHVPDAEATVKELVSVLKPGGRVFTQSDFTDNGNYPMHHIREDGGDGLWKAAGLEKESELWWRKPLVTQGGK
jgi:hypothetical protein